MAVRRSMGGWRCDEVVVQWEACAASIDEALAAVPEAHRVARSSVELEELLGAVSDVVEPLDAWQDAERAWRRLRRHTERPRT
ncbi:MAG: hypothetical protein ACRDZO_07475 [Egibacteraceae bacterium]